jgi:hypothetical protein
MKVFLISCLVTVLCCISSVFAQKKAKLQTFTSWEEALRNPEKVGVLNLTGQKLTALPATIGKFTNLQQLILSKNELTNLPIELKTLTKLQKLDLSDNRFKEFDFPIEELKSLKELNLGTNRLRKVPTSVLTSDSLEKLYLYQNRLRTIPKEITRLKNLKELRLGAGLRFFWNGNKIKSLPENIGELQQLEELHLPDNRLRTLPASFSKLRKLRFLELLHNHFKEVPQEVLALDSLGYVSIWDRNFSQKHKTEVASRLPHTHILYEPKFEGNFSALNLNVRQGRYTEILVGWAKAFKKDFVLAGLGLTGGYQFHDVYSVRASAWVNFLPTVGLSIVHYGSLQERLSATGFAPEIGVGKGLWRIFYSYTWAWGGLKDINRHAIQAQILMRW